MVPRKYKLKLLDCLFVDTDLVIFFPLFMPYDVAFMIYAEHVFM
jgi:hypothetical protein